MKYRRLGSTELTVSVVGVGTWQFGGEWGRTYDQAEADAMLDAARDCGINLVDTAECYGDHLSEELVGRAIVVVANLEPRTIRGLRSECMLLAAEGEELSLLIPDRPVEPGTPVA